MIFIWVMLMMMMIVVRITPPPPSSFPEYFLYSYSGCPYISFSVGMTTVLHYDMDCLYLIDNGNDGDNNG